MKTTAKQRAKQILPKLYPFQRTGVKFLDMRRRCLLGDDMGLGKTIQVLAWAAVRCNIRPITIVCPASVKYYWEREAHIWLPNDSVSVLNGRTVDPNLVRASIRIVNYAILSDWGRVLRKSAVVIADECHYLRSMKTKRTKAVLKLCRHVPICFFLSGTPILNRPVEFFPVLNLLDSNTFASFWAYVQEFCDARHTHWGWNFNGAKNLDLLHKLVNKRIMLRRLKRNVLDQLPEKRRAVIPLAIENMLSYKAAERNFKRWLMRAGTEDMTITSPGVKAKTEALKQMVLLQKLPQCVKWIEDFIDTGEKLVVFVIHQHTVRTLYQYFKKCAVILYGKTKGRARQEAVERFKRDKRIRLFIGNIDAAGIGIDGLQHAASNAAFLELAWTPSQHVQAEDRIYRIGQTNKVTCYYLIAHDTIEERIINMLDAKREILEQTLDGAVNIDEQFWTELLEHELE